MGGATYERELVTALTDCGRVAMRAPSSGSATQRDLPDVLAGTHTTFPEGWDGPDTPLSTVWAIELKTTSSGTVYAQEAEVEALESFAAAFGAVPMVGARFKRPGVRTPYYLVRTDTCRRTSSGNAAVSEDEAADRAYATVKSATANADAEVWVR